MSHAEHPEKNKTDKNPAHQTDPSHGSVNAAQVTGDNMKRKDLARGSEPETRSSSSNRS